MAKFRIVKRFSLDFLSPEWKEAYIDFNMLTVADVRKSFPALTKLSEEGEDNEKAMDSVLKIIKDHFVKGKAVNENGELVDLKVDDIEELPVGILTKATDFLSQQAELKSAEPSEKS